MLAKLSSGNKGGLTNLVIDKARNLFKNETVAFKGAFLTSLREKLLPYQQQGMLESLDPEEENKIIKQLYDEISGKLVFRFHLMG